MTSLEQWLVQATKKLSRDSAARVRTEIQEHYESARETAIASGAAAEQANSAALAALGSAKTANQQYRRVLLTAVEESMMRQDQRESSVLCTRALRWIFRAIPLAALTGAAVAFPLGQSMLAKVLLIVAIVFGLVFAVPTLPIYTPKRARIYRYAKWAGITAALVLGMGWSAGVVSLMPLAWTEWVRASIRRKLPVAQWPRQLYR